jgi:hypothetical protein
MNTSSPRAAEGEADTTLETLLNEYEYARIVNRSVASIRRDRVRRVGCPFVKLGALVRYRPDDIRAHIERNIHVANPDAGAEPEAR